MNQLALFWFYGDLGRRSVWAPNWLEALGLALSDAGLLPNRIVCEVGRDGRVLVQDLDRDRLYLLVAQGVSLRAPAAEDEPPLATLSAAGYP